MSLVGIGALVKQRSINVIVIELREAYARKDSEAVARLEAERKAWKPTKTTAPASPEAKARRRAFWKLNG